MGTDPAHAPRRGRCAPAAPTALVLLAGILLQACSGGGADTRKNAAPPEPPAPPPVSDTSGLDQRPANATCLAWARPDAGASISLTRYTELSFDAPVFLLQAPGDAGHWYVVEQAGTVRRFAPTDPAASTFVDLRDRVRSGGETGLLGMAFHPDFPRDPRVFLSYTNDANGLVSRVSSFESRDGGVTLAADSERVVLSVDQPEPNHNGGHIAFGPDGYLYVGLGDGGGGGDQHGNPGNGQRLTTLLGKLLRIDVDSAAPYAIPPTNPFAHNAPCPAAGRSSGECPEIYAWGLRNPWRWSFDRANGELWLADVGQNQWEEVDRVSVGGNYGWRCREGAHDFNPGSTGCDSARLIDPIAEYDHGFGSSITGGYVYRGPQPTQLAGRYLFGDFGSGRIWAWIPENAQAPRQPTELLQSGLTISSFAEGNDAELYVVNYGGTLHRVVFGAEGGEPVPQTLTATGCVDAGNPARPAAGLIPYDVNAPFWSDGATKERWIALPDTGVVVAGSDGDWEFPSGTVLMQHFRLGTRLVETRLFMRHPDGNWGGYTYEWNTQQSDATLLRGGAVRDPGEEQQWIFPSEAQCLECHTSAAGRTLGLETAQLNRTLTYPQTGRTANQLATLSHIGVLIPPLAQPEAQAALSDPADGSAGLEQRARAYLHTNCAHCHRPGGPTPSGMDLRYTTMLAATNACNASPSSGDLGLGVDARLIAPGAASLSLLVNRMNRRDEHAMPPLGSAQVDAAGVALVSAWVDSLGSC